MVWPVRGHASGLAATGQNRCFDPRGAHIDCGGTGQDGGYVQVASGHSRDLLPCWRARSIDSPA